MVLIALATSLIAAKACAFEPSVVGRLEVWNRTQLPIKIVGQDATFDVPACGYATRDGFLLNRYEIVDDQGRFIALHGGGSGSSHGIPAYEMVTSAGAIYADTHPPLEPLPPCEGVVRGQDPASS